MAISHSVSHVTTRPSSHAWSCAAFNIHRGHDEFKAAKNSSHLFYEKIKQRKLACGIQIVLHNVKWLCLLLLLLARFGVNYMEKKKLHGITNSFFLLSFFPSVL